MDYFFAYWYHNYFFHRNDVTLNRTFQIKNQLPPTVIVDAYEIQLDCFRLHGHHLLTPSNTQSTKYQVRSFQFLNEKNERIKQRRWHRHNPLLWTSSTPSSASSRFRFSSTTKTMTYSWDRRRFRRECIYTWISGICISSGRWWRNRRKKDSQKMGCGRLHWEMLCFGGIRLELAMRGLILCLSRRSIVAFTVSSFFWQTTYFVK